MTTWLTLEEAAKHLKIGKSTIYRLAREGDLPAHRMGRVWRFDAEELDAWVKRTPSEDNKPKKSR
jgi:excisionase family DNA binding protein